MDIKFTVKLATNGMFHVINNETNKVKSAHEKAYQAEKQADNLNSSVKKAAKRLQPIRIDFDEDEEEDATDAHERAIQEIAEVVAQAYLAGEEE